MPAGGSTSDGIQEGGRSRDRAGSRELGSPKRSSSSAATAGVLEKALGSCAGTAELGREPIGKSPGSGRLPKSSNPSWNDSPGASDETLEDLRPWL